MRTGISITRLFSMYLLIYTFHSAAKRLFSDNYVFFNGGRSEDPLPHLSFYSIFEKAIILRNGQLPQIVACALVELEAL